MKASIPTMKTRFLLLLMVVSAWQGLTPVHAAPTVIFDSGRTLSLVPYFKSIKTQAAISAQTQQPSPLAALPVEGTASERLQVQAHTLPVRTPEMTPGAVRPQSVNMPYLERPVFVVGYDRLSLQWLQLHRQRLETLHALGLVVNVEDTQQLTQLRQLATPLELHALPGSSFAKQFALSHYPALISASRIEQ